ncbi:hypothetical protein SAMN05192575_11320 [Nocardioides alpinus]|uniref:Uncharacterized protein n=1 Tax=Nocardioides alpinus TaxID=748909 RepID=A0A1I1B4R8_9ACTN|nr:hypothetical protein [Nocardioides alpinus]PKH40157.1 hypothetical protein CXG46_13445 [Nocardioides alpinus]SFB44636.1 hypothetical protein SAMN05192575_11320 [Nocardioides alpinus]
MSEVPQVRFGGDQYHVVWTLAVLSPGIGLRPMAFMEHATTALDDQPILDDLVELRAVDLPGGLDPLSLSSWLAGAVRREFSLATIGQSATYLEILFLRMTWESFDEDYLAPAIASLEATDVPVGVRSTAIARRDGAEGWPEVEQVTVAFIKELDLLADRYQGGMLSALPNPSAAAPIETSVEEVDRGTAPDQPLVAPLVELAVSIEDTSRPLSVAASIADYPPGEGDRGEFETALGADTALTGVSQTATSRTSSRDSADLEMTVPPADVFKSNPPNPLAIPAGVSEVDRSSDGASPPALPPPGPPRVIRLIYFVILGDAMESGLKRRQHRILRDLVAASSADRLRDTAARVVLCDDGIASQTELGAVTATLFARPVASAQLQGSGVLDVVKCCHELKDLIRRDSESLAYGGLGAGETTIVVIPGDVPPSDTSTLAAVRGLGEGADLLWVLAGNVMSIMPEAYLRNDWGHEVIHDHPEVHREFARKLRIAATAGIEGELDAGPDLGAQTGLGRRLASRLSHRRKTPPKR